MAIRPELTSRQRWMLSSSMLSVIGSIVDHHAKLPAVHIRAVLAEIATAISTADVPDPPDESVAGRGSAEDRRASTRRNTKRC